MKKKHTKRLVKYHHNELPIDTKTDWKRVDAFTEEELEKNAKLDKDTLCPDENFWQVAKLVKPKTSKAKVILNLDADLLHWLKDQDANYQTHINSLLRTCMDIANSSPQRHHNPH